MTERSRGRPGWLHVGPLESRLQRHWDADAFPPAESLLAIMTVAALPQALATRLAAHLTGGIIIGPGAVPDLPGFEGLRGVALPIQAGSWERTAGVRTRGRSRNPRALAHPAKRLITSTPLAEPRRWHLRASALSRASGHPDAEEPPGRGSDSATGRVATGAGDRSPHPKA
ncbi:hypothetical protein HS041_29485 [Planomonospora sp. ID67723]|uniref:hypothetical protein n=1 Tax=Planomonospora sp. ID67723 TaxID=2738134 RepID=UPI0018C397F9|nr:hypothetical protein [Planomonospora sp. ID67723]MBG0831851.1 hypothetical protein [Planomonospora sp. ID67723]